MRLQAIKRSCCYGPFFIFFLFKSNRLSRKSTNRSNYSNLSAKNKVFRRNKMHSKVRVLSASQNVVEFQFGICLPNDSLKSKNSVHTNESLVPESSFLDKNEFWILQFQLFKFQNLRIWQAIQICLPKASKKLKNSVHAKESLNHEIRFQVEIKSLIRHHYSFLFCLT